MRQLRTEILVIGGGATGTGAAWDAALRGFRTILVEKRDVTHGTTGRYHGLLHSGARYVLKDERSAAECVRENRILRRTHTHCIEDTGGFFVVTPEDEDDYPDRFAAACQRLDIPCNEISTASALRREPLLNPRISRVFEVPDAAADSFLAAHATAHAARQAGALLLPYHEVTGFFVAGGEGDRTVTGASVLDAVSGEEVRIDADMIINATGAWAGRTAALAGIEVGMILGKGVMLATNSRLTNTVINRCKMPADGDIIVPIQTVSVVGTTDEQVADADSLPIERWEVDLLLAEGDKLTPGLSDSRILRAWAGIRPLYEDDFSGQSRDATRSLVLLEHSQRDGVDGFITITGGKWTTFRLMAEAAVDAACAQLAVSRPCRTSETAVPGAEQGHFWLGHRLRAVEESRQQAELICECELVTRAMLENAVRSNPTVTLDDLRRDVRLGMGPCQGGFCTYRAVGLLHGMRGRGPESAHEGGDSRTWAVSSYESDWNAAELHSPARCGGRENLAPEILAPPAAKQEGLDAGSASPAINAESTVSLPNLLLLDFLQERWKGVAPILWGQQLQQERMDELIYLSIMNVDHLPGEREESPMTSFYRA